jgi:5-methylcytosine-specific restriction endonuclease McrA
MDASRRSNGPDRGNSYARRARKHYLLDEFGNGETCECTFCGTELNFDSVTSDRVVTGSNGGSYQRDNLVPACKFCNLSRGDTPFMEFMIKVGPVKLHASVG